MVYYVQHGIYRFEAPWVKLKVHETDCKAHARVNGIIKRSNAILIVIRKCEL